MMLAKTTASTGLSEYLQCGRILIYLSKTPSHYRQGEGVE